MGWQLSGSVATLQRADLSLSVPIDRPQCGLQVHEALGASVPPIRPMGYTALPTSPDGRERIVEAYVRATELIVQYDQAPRRNARFAAVWCDLGEALSVAAIELRLYTQTNSLTSHPAIDVTTEIPRSASVWNLRHDTWCEITDPPRASIPADSGAFLIRMPDTSLSYAEFVIPADFQDARLEFREGGMALQYRFFSEPLEKGVIRVARIWSAWLDRGDDQFHARRLYGQFCQSAPPLSA